MVTKRRKPQSDNEQGASATPARPSQQARPKRRIAMPQSSARLKQHQGQPQQQASAGAPGAEPSRAGAPASEPGREGGSPASTSPARPTAPVPARPTKRFSVARAQADAAAAAEQLAPSVERSDAEAAAAAAREGATDAARRRLDQRRRAGAFRPDGQTGSDSLSQRSSLDGPAEQQGADAETKPVKKLHLSWPAVLIGVLLAIVVALVAVFSWDRWLRFDDASDFQGTWYANGTASTISIDGEQMHLTDDVAYSYTLDTGAKTISFTFGTYEGQGRYRFSADRSELVITDGADFSFWGNLFDDVSWRFGQAIDNLQGKEIAREAAVDGVTVLDRTKTQS